MISEIKCYQYIHYVDEIGFLDMVAMNAANAASGW
jgi:hypothetical protein